MVSKPEFERQYQTSDERILANFFGGLNTTAAKLNCPFEDAPGLVNMTVNDSGKLEKRKGTDTLYTALDECTSGYIVNMTTGLGYNFLVSKIARSLQIFEIINNAATRVMLKNEVFSTAATLTKPQTIRINEIEPRLIFLTGVNKPVQLRFVERSAAPLASATSVIIPNAAKFKSAGAGNCLVFENRNRVSAPSFSYNAGTKELTVSGLTNLGAGNKTLDLILITWQWWAEALTWYGDRFWKSATRFNATTTDRLVAVPAKITTDMDVLGGTYSFYPFNLYKQSNLTAFNRVSNGQPQLADDWYHSDGAIYNYTASDYVNPSPFYVIFGATSGSTPIPVYFARRREMRFRSGQGFANASNLSVYVNNVASNKLFTGHGLTPAYGDIWMFKDDGSGGIISSTSATDAVKWISFEHPVAGVPQDAKVEIVNTEATHIGSTASSGKFDYNDGTWVPAFGLGLYADYANGYYPADGDLFQERLCLSAFPHQPFTTVMSATSDTMTPGQFYMFFQVTDDLEGKDTDPFDIVISSDPKDFITKIHEWQSHLFIFTRYNLYRAGGVQTNQTLTPTSRSVSLVSTIGNINRHTVARTDTYLVYMSDTGIYSVLDRDNATEYVVNEISIKIRSEFQGVFTNIYDTLSWLAYDSKEKRIYAALPVQQFGYTARKLYVFNVFRAAWSQLDTQGGFQLFHGDQYIDRQLGLQFGAMAMMHWDTNGVPNRFGLISFDADHYFDFGNRTGTTLNAKPIISYTTADRQQIYSLIPSSLNRSAFPVTPFSRANDLIVKLNGVKQVAGVDYLKRSNSYIYLARNPGAGKTLTIEPRMLVTDSDSSQYLYNVTAPVDVSPILARLDNVVRRDYLNFSLGDTTTTTSVVDTTGMSALLTNRLYGYAYPCWYVSPAFTLEYITKVKRIFHLYVIFDNSLGNAANGNAFYTGADVNVSNNQDPSEIVDTFRRRLNASMVYSVNDNLDGSVAYDLYKYPALAWDDMMFDIMSSTAQANESYLSKIPLEGSGITYNFGLFSFDDSTFRINGYQVVGLVQQQGLSYRE